MSGYFVCVLTCVCLYVCMCAGGCMYVHECMGVYVACMGVCGVYM